MSLHRFDIDASAGPAREGVLGGAMLLVRVHLSSAMNSSVSG